MNAAFNIESDLRKAWNRKLNLWWRTYNEEFLGGALEPPLIRIGRSERTLGHWDGITRTLTLSEIHIARDPWLAVMETLRHEMAHQYVGEILRVPDENPHGEAFREACRKLRCSPAARAAPGDLDQARDSDGDAILRRLKKLLSLAGSPNEHEARVAVQKARRLLVKYNIDVVELDRERRFETRCLGVVKGRHTAAELWLASILHGFFFVEVLWAHSYDPLRDRPGSILQIFGTPENLDMAEYVHGYLTSLLDRLWKDYRKAGGLRGNRERQRYFAGVLEGFYRKLKDQERTFRETHALVWKGDARLQEYYRYLNPRVQTRYGGGVTPTRAYADGLRDGRRVTIHKPVAESGSGFGGYLKG